MIYTDSRAFNYITDNISGIPCKTVSHLLATPKAELTAADGCVNEENHLNLHFIVISGGCLVQSMSFQCIHPISNITSNMKNLNKNTEGASQITHVHYPTPFCSINRVINVFTLKNPKKTKFTLSSRMMLSFKPSVERWTLHSKVAAFLT